MLTQAWLESRLLLCINSIEYIYGQEIWSGDWAQILGNVNAPGTSTALIDPLIGGVLAGYRVAVNIPPIQTTSRSFEQTNISESQTTNITYTRLASATHPLPNELGFVSSLFRLDATSDNGILITQFNRPFTLTVTADSIGTWSAEAAGISGSDGGNSFSAQSSGTISITPSVSLAYWDDTQQRWKVVVGTKADFANHQLVAQTDLFAEYAVIVKVTHEVYLPLIRR